MAQEYIFGHYFVVGDNFTGGNTVVTGWGRNQSSILNDSMPNADILQVYIKKKFKNSFKKKS